MVITKYLCDRCKQEINEEQLCRIGWLEFGFESPKIEQFDFCLDCKTAIMDFATTDKEKASIPIKDFAIDNYATEAPTETETEKQEQKAAEQTEPSEVIQASAPKRRMRSTKERVELDRQIATEMYNKGKSIGEIARSLGHSYQCIRNWVR